MSNREILRLTASDGCHKESFLAEPVADEYIGPLPDESVLWTCVKRKWVVSTVERDSSAILGPRRFLETIVWRWNEASQDRGEMIAMGSGLAYHQAACNALLGGGEDELKDLNT